MLLRNSYPAWILDKIMSDFVTSYTRRFFAITGFSSSFLSKDISQWEEDDDYISVKASIRCLRVVNDIAEHGVALMEEYNKLHTNNEEQKQFLLSGTSPWLSRTVKDYRKEHPDTKKSTLMK